MNAAIIDCLYINYNKLFIGYILIIKAIIYIDIIIFRSKVHFIL